MIIPLEKLIEYKGNRYELSRAMIELALNGHSLLASEAKLNDDKYIPVVIKNMVNGTIKFDYEDEDKTISENSPFLKGGSEYDEEKYAEALAEKEGSKTEEAEEDEEEDEEDEEDDDEEDEELSEEAVEKDAE